MAKRRQQNYNGVTDRELEVLVCRYFLNMSLAKTARQMENLQSGGQGVSRQRVHEMEIRALRKLRRKPKAAW
jgi:DNA-directed RNA polymerase sigma subunit (sigma70/sigma32)